MRRGPENYHENHPPALGAGADTLSRVSRTCQSVRGLDARSPRTVDHGYHENQPMLLTWWSVTRRLPVTDTTLNQIDTLARCVIEQLSEEPGARPLYEIGELCFRALEGDLDARQQVDQALAWLASRIEEVSDEPQARIVWAAG